MPWQARHEIHIVKISAITFNLQNGQLWNAEQPDEKHIDFARSIKFLRSLNADIYFLQEVEQGHEGGHQIDPPPNYTRLRESFPDYHSLFDYPPLNPDELPFGLGLAIFSRWPLCGHAVHHLPASSLQFEFEGRERKPSQRTLQRACLDIGGMPLHLLNTHLQAYFMIGGNSKDYPEQRQLLEVILRGLGGFSLIGGDFNSSPEEGLREQFETFGFRTAQSTQNTWKRRPYVVDHLFYGPGLRLLESRVIETNCSDHHAVRGVFEVANH